MGPINGTRRSRLYPDKSITLKLAPRIPRHARGMSAVWQWRKRHKIWNRGPSRVFTLRNAYTHTSDACTHASSGRRGTSVDTYHLHLRSSVQCGPSLPVVSLPAKCIVLLASVSHIRAERQSSMQRVIICHRDHSPSSPLWSHGLETGGELGEGSFDQPHTYASVRTYIYAY